MGVDVFDTLDESSMKCIRFDVCKVFGFGRPPVAHISSMKCIRFDVCKIDLSAVPCDFVIILNEVHTF